MLLLFVIGIQNETPLSLPAQLAMDSLVLVPGMASVTFGVLALMRIRRSAGLLQGKKLSLVSIVISSCWLAIPFVGWLLSLNGH